MTNSQFSEYTTDYISGRMSLRPPQQKSLEILDEIFNAVKPSKNTSIDDALTTINKLYPTCSDFEREFPSLTFALATGVGKTRLMGAFITYLYTQHNIKNFFVVAPGTTIYEKLRDDLSPYKNDKYVFKGLDCFAVNPPLVSSGEDYRNKRLPFNSSDVNIYVYNIGKFNTESTRLRSGNVERLGEPFFKKLSRLDDLVVIMDESHHYRAKSGTKALNDLKPILGLELTATPLTNKGNKQIPFKNVVYEYPLSQAIADGFTRTPYALTRTDIEFYNFGDAELDRTMLEDGIAEHEATKLKLQAYSENYGTKLIKPFMLVVCKDTEHADKVEKFVKSNDFMSGDYKNKTLVIHSNQSGAIKDDNMRLLLSVESPDNPVEVVIHVDKLKEGWDVNNLYTIVPLRTATSKILREQMVGRGLRLPFGERTGDKFVDQVVLTAHDKFDDIIKEAKKGDSIFKAGNIISVTGKPQKPEIVQPKMNFSYDTGSEDNNEGTEPIDDEIRDRCREKVEAAINKAVQDSSATPKEQQENITQDVEESIKEDKDIGEIYNQNKDFFHDWLPHEIERNYVKAKEKFIPIPKIKISPTGIEEYEFTSFKLDVSSLTHTPIENNKLYQNLIDPREVKREAGKAIGTGINPRTELISKLREKPEIDYNKSADLLNSLVTDVLEHFRKKYGVAGTNNIIYMYKNDITGIIYNQMMEHFQYKDEGALFEEEIIRIDEVNLRWTYVKEKELVDLFSDDFNSRSVKSVLFKGIKKGVFDCANFDSAEGELTFARMLERDDDVINWLRPAPDQFRLYYKGNNKYIPDFVVETEDIIYLTEIKGEDRAKQVDVESKKVVGVKYCISATNWSKANGYKEWRYLFIPSKEATESVSFKVLSERFWIKEPSSPLPL